MNILSLFDGISCAQLALTRAGIIYDKYYACEINQHAIQITQKNFPNTIQLGDINNWSQWNIQKPDLIIAGFPCQGFSVAGKGLNFQDKRSKLFFRAVQILKYYKPKYFLFENVKMKREWQDIISQHLGVEPILIDSSLLSAQSRKRLYWTNIPNITQPADKHIYLKDIIEHGYVDKLKSYCIDSNYWKGGNLKRYFNKHSRQLVFEIGIAKNKKRISINTKSLPPCTFYETRTTEGKEMWRKMQKLLGIDTTPRNSKTKMYITSLHNKANCIITVDSLLNYIVDDQYIIRKLTPIECERLQTLPDNYTEGISNTQRYICLGNGFTVDVIAHILNFAIDKRLRE